MLHSNDTETAAANRGLTDLDVQSLLLLPDNGRLLAGTFRGGVFRSDAGGDSWQAAGRGLGDQNVPVLTTKLHTPSPRPNLVSRPHLIQRLGEGLQPDHKLTVISAPAGFGKTTLWFAQQVAPLNLPLLSVKRLAPFD